MHLDIGRYIGDIVGIHWDIFGDRLYIWWI